MVDITPAEVVPFIIALVCVLAGYLLARRGEDSGPSALAAGILYAVALGFLILGLIAWGMRLLG